MSHTGGRRSPTPQHTPCQHRGGLAGRQRRDLRSQEPERAYWGRGLCTARQNQTAASRVVWGKSGAPLKPPGPPLGGAVSIHPQVQPPASRTLDHLLPTLPTVSPLPPATIGHAACSTCPLFTARLPGCRVSSGRVGTLCCSWLCAPCLSRDRAWPAAVT